MAKSFGKLLFTRFASKTMTAMAMMRPTCWRYPVWLLRCLGLLCWVLPVAGQMLPAHAPEPDLSLPPIRWAEVAAASEEHIVNYDHGAPLEYKLHRRDQKGEMTRLVLESNQGSVARLLERNGQALTADEDKDERNRLQDILDHPGDYARHVRREEGSRTYATELLQAMPKSMMWQYVPGQPQVPHGPGTSVVLDFSPDAAYKPSSLVTEALTGIAGRVWIDAKTHNVVRIQGRVLHPINFGWGGVLARIKEGGTVELDQRAVSERRWLFVHLVEHLSIREVLVHTAQEDAEMSATDIKPLPNRLSVREAVERLLSLPIATR